MIYSNANHTQLCKGYLYPTSRNFGSQNAHKWNILDIETKIIKTLILSCFNDLVFHFLFLFEEKYCLYLVIKTWYLVNVNENFL